MSAMARALAWCEAAQLAADDDEEAEDDCAYGRSRGAQHGRIADRTLGVALPWGRSDGSDIGQQLDG